MVSARGGRRRTALPQAAGRAVQEAMLSARSFFRSGPEDEILLFSIQLTLHGFE